MKNKAIVVIIVILCFVGIYFFIFQFTHSEIEKSTPSTSLKNSFFYRMYQWDIHKVMVERFYEYQELSDQVKDSMVVEEKSFTNEEISNRDDSSQDDTIIGTPKHPETGKPWAQIFASLTGSTGSLGVSGKARNATFIIQGIQQGTSFQQGAGSSFSVDVHSIKGNKRVTVNSPSFATNRALQSLTIGIDPFSMYMTLNGRLQLDLPGDIVGTMYNTSNGTSSTATLRNGYFSVSVPLAPGVNNITASGKWMTIELQFPGISVTIS